MIDPEASPWDLAAIAPILTEAGGKFSDLDGRETIWSGHGFATNGHLHEPILRLLAEHRDS
jgi:histidinol-phosphatase